jgi:hypothetical protein
MRPALVDQAAPASPLSRGGLALSVWCVVAAFGTYFCMYAFRKPFTAATYTDVTLWNVGHLLHGLLEEVAGQGLDARHEEGRRRGHDLVVWFGGKGVR